MSRNTQSSSLKSYRRQDEPDASKNLAILMQDVRELQQQVQHQSHQLDKKIAELAMHIVLLYARLGDHHTSE